MKAKRLRSILKFHGLALAALIASPVLADDRDDRSVELPHFSGLRMEASDIRSESGERHTVTVHYGVGVDRESLGDGDIWIVSRNGYNQVGTLETVEEWRIKDRLHPDEEEGEREIGETEKNLSGFWDDDELPIREEIRERIRDRLPHGWKAAYSVAAPEGGWTEGNAGRYAVLLQPEEVRLVHGGFLSPTLLGAFHNRIGEAPPTRLPKARINIESSPDGTVAEVTLVLPTSGYEVTDWGEVRGDGETISVPVSFTGPGDDEVVNPVITPISHRYDLSDLPEGEYTFVVNHNGEKLAAKRFEVGEKRPVPADVELTVGDSLESQVSLHARIHFLDPFFVLEDRGEPQLDDKTFVIDATAQRVVFVRPPDEPAITEVDYELEVPEPGEYRVVYRINGAPYAKTRFKLGLADGDLPPRDEDDDDNEGDEDENGDDEGAEDGDGDEAERDVDHDGDENGESDDGSDGNQEGSGLWSDVVTELKANVGEQTVEINASADFNPTSLNVSLNQWGDPTREGRTIYLDLFVDRTESTENPDSPPVPKPVLSQTFRFDDLRPGNHLFVLRINGSPVDREMFLINRGHPFGRWMEKWIGSDKRESEKKPSMPKEPDDADDDGTPDFVEWAMDSSPVDPKDRGRAHPVLKRDDNGLKIGLRFKRRVDAMEHVDYRIEVSEDLVNWRQVDEDEIDEDINSSANGVQEVTKRLRSVIDDLDSQFVRVRVVEETAEVE